MRNLSSAIALALLAAPSVSVAGAGIVTDGTAGAQQTIAGVNAGAGTFTIPQTLGTVAGNNLFHSFSTFNVDTGQIAQFTTTTATLQNVISRVTGGAASQVNGTLQLSAAGGSSPAFYFVNPAGVVFGQGASVSVPGAFHVGTADYVKFGNERFYANPATPGSSFSTAAPEAFGFLGTTPNGTTLLNTIKIDTAKLAINSGNTLGVVAGDVVLTSGGGIDSAATEIRVVALGAKAADVSLSDPSALQASGKLEMSGGAVIRSNSAFGQARGKILVRAGDIAINGGGTDTGIFAYAASGTFADAGHIDVAASGELSLVNRGWIDSSTEMLGGSGVGKSAGDIKVAAGSLRIDGAGSGGGIVSNVRTGGFGSAGTVDVTVTGSAEIVSGGVIDTSTLDAGNAGTITVRAGSLTLDLKGTQANTGIGSQAATGSTGHAGDVTVRVEGTLAIRNGAGIDSSTLASGKAGKVDVSAGTVLVDGSGVILDGGNLVATESSIEAKAGSTSTSGWTGDVKVVATDSIVLSAKGKISIQNDAQALTPGTITPTTLTVQAPRITLKDASITAASTKNVNASKIEIKATDYIYLDPSSITTSANTGIGGNITIDAGRRLTLESSQITTTATAGTRGGDIRISADSLVLNTGFVLANAPVGVQGGDVHVDVKNLVPSGNSLFKGGQTLQSFTAGVFGYNVIQAAAPQGLSGNVDVTAPALDVSGVLAGLAAGMIDTGGLGRSPCQVTGGSSMVQAGRGGFAPSARGLLGPSAAAPAKAGAVTFVPDFLRLAFGPPLCAG